MAHKTINVSESNFAQEVKAPLVLVDFWAEWCGPCKALGPKLEEIAGELEGTVKIVKVNVDQSQGLAAQFQIRSIPTMILFKNGEPVDQIMGNVPKEKIVGFITQNR